MVLDLGADVGSTPCFFLHEGARRVIAVEGEKERFDQLIENMEGDERVAAIHLMVSCAGHFEQLIRDCRPDIVNVDCEYCEKDLPKVPMEVLWSVDEYLIEAHSNLYLDIEALLSKMAPEYNWWRILPFAKEHSYV